MRQKVFKHYVIFQRRVIKDDPVQVNGQKKHRSRHPNAITLNGFTELKVNNYTVIEVLEVLTAVGILFDKKPEGKTDADAAGRKNCI